MSFGIGATAAIFSLCDAMLWRPKPLPRMDSLVTVLQRDPSDPDDWDSATLADIDETRRGSLTLDSLASWESGLANLASAGTAPDRVGQALVNTNFFDVTGVRPALGRAFLPGEDQPGKDQELIVSDQLWRTRFQAAPDIVGRLIRLDDAPYTVIGVMPPSFQFPLTTDVWTPLGLKPEQRNSHSAQILQSIARLKPGRTLEEAAAEVNTIAARLERSFPETYKNRCFVVWPGIRLLSDHFTQQYLIILFASVLFVLLIACANVTNLQFARATGRLREVAVRRAAGASRAQLILQFVVESTLLSLSGALLGLLIAQWGIRLLHMGMPPEVERYILGFKDVQVDGHALLFMLLAALASGILSGLAPAWQSSQPNLTDALREGGRGTGSKARQRLRNILVAAEIALATVLLVGAGLMVRGFRALVDNGRAIEPETLLTL